MSIPIRYLKLARGAEGIVAAVERSVAEHHLAPGDQVPTVRQLADNLGVSPSTVASAYRTLASRGVVTGRGRLGTRISAGPPLPSRPVLVVPAGVRNLADGNPDPALLPSLRPALQAIRAPYVSYGEAHADVAELVALAKAQFEADAIPAQRVIVVGGALDGVERVLVANLRPGDRIAVEDPGFPRVFDLVSALGLISVPTAIDEHGMTAASLAASLDAGAAAMILTPRAQNPTGAALNELRARELRRVLRAHPEVLVIEDDHAGPVAGIESFTLAKEGSRRWAVVRSVAKSLGPDLRVALLTGDRATLDRVEGRLRIGTGWVSHILQHTVVELWSDPKTSAHIEAARSAYTRRRAAALEALAARQIEASAPSGLNLWVPVVEEDAAVAGLMARGWAVAAGERFRIHGAPALRITIATLEPKEAKALAADLAEVLHPEAPASTTA